MNSLYQQLTQQQQQQIKPAQSPQSSNISNKELFQYIANSKNPQELLQKVMNNNPTMKNVVQLMKSSKMTPKQFFYYFAQQKGVNPNDFLNTLK